MVGTVSCSGKNVGGVMRWRFYEIQLEKLTLLYSILEKNEKKRNIYI